VDSHSSLPAHSPQKQKPRRSGVSGKKSFIAACT